ncbi:hypothetical protein OE88DRAFT_1739014 [Heliocybe sulcata]|uniref:Fungal-type protein kinase domain-containing protein n=1 Tax=Heliocybe sulcata TaxID=5364 RepID=A0A5C3MNE4_9AGAM|nr:hypothetical protein OE88DRAFT_1739014 [Heliocybe sulcata]
MEVAQDPSQCGTLSGYVRDNREGCYSPSSEPDDWDCRVGSPDKPLQWTVTHCRDTITWRVVDSVKDGCILTSTRREKTHEHGPLSFAPRIGKAAHIGRTESKRAATNLSSHVELLEALQYAVTGHQSIRERGTKVPNLALVCVTRKASDCPITPFLREKKSIIENNYRTSPCRSFQPFKILAGITTSKHDYLDDLECFFWILCHLVFIFQAPGKTEANPPYSFQGLHSRKKRRMIQAKDSLLGNRELVDYISSGMGHGIAALFGRMQQFFLNVTEESRQELIARRKGITLRQLKMHGHDLPAPHLGLPTVDEKSCSEWLGPVALQHYTAILNMIGTSIEWEDEPMQTSLLRIQEREQA